MLTLSKPCILNDLTRLQEIYLLRSFAWENSPGKADLNTKIYPNGYRDILDEKSIHFVATNDRDEIIAAARLTHCEHIDELPYPGVYYPYQNHFPKAGSIAFYSRLVIHPDYRKCGYSQALDEVRIKEHLELGASYGLVSVNSKRVLQLTPQGFQNLGPAIDASGQYPFSSLNVMYLAKENITF